MFISIWRILNVVGSASIILVNGKAQTSESEELVAARVPNSFSHASTLCCLSDQSRALATRPKAAMELCRWKPFLVAFAQIDATIKATVGVSREVLRQGCSIPRTTAQRRRPASYSIPRWLSCSSRFATRCPRPRRRVRWRRRRSLLRLAR
jgi:hypothetical protein